MNTLLLILVAMIAPIPISYLVEALRRPPKYPETSSWAPHLKYEYLDVKGNKLRYIKTGSGPVIVLLHTLRTQLDIWQKVIPKLAENHTVYAVDHIGHGFSDIPDSEYKPELFFNAVSGFLESLNIEGVTIVGESIGGSLGLMLAARHNPRVTQVVAVDPYEYDLGRGVYRSSLFARLLFSISTIPILGSTFWRLRSFPIFKNIIQGGVKNNKNIPKGLLCEMNRVGNRQGHYQAFMNLVKYFPQWEYVRNDYDNITIPVLLLYGEHDWSTMQERQEVYALIPNAKIKVLLGSGHFASLDASKDVADEVINFISN